MHSAFHSRFHSFLHRLRALRAACVAVALALLSACTTVSEPVRPQALALPDTERPVTRPGATPRERIVEIATQEWARWGGQVVRLGRDDTSCVTYSPVPAPELPALLPEIPEAKPVSTAEAGAPAPATTDTESKPTAIHHPLPAACPFRTAPAWKPRPWAARWRAATGASSAKRPAAGK